MSRRFSFEPFDRERDAGDIKRQRTVYASVSRPAFAFSIPAQILLPPAARPTPEKPDMTAKLPALLQCRRAVPGRAWSSRRASPRRASAPSGLEFIREHTSAACAPQGGFAPLKLFLAAREKPAGGGGRAVLEAPLFVFAHTSRKPNHVLGRPVDTLCCQKCFSGVRPCNCRTFFASGIQGKRAASCCFPKSRCASHGTGAEAPSNTVHTLVTCTYLPTYLPPYELSDVKTPQNCISEALPCPSGTLNAECCHYDNLKPFCLKPAPPTRAHRM